MSLREPILKFIQIKGTIAFKGHRDKPIIHQMIRVMVVMVVIMIVMVVMLMIVMMVVMMLMIVRHLRFKLFGIAFCLKELRVQNQRQRYLAVLSV